jgi:hypothetical protein
MTNQDDPAILASLLGQRIAELRRILYVSPGNICGNVGPIQIALAGGSVVLLDSASDGEALSVKCRPWIDYFADPLSEENREFVARSGKWTSFDVTHELPYSKIVGETIKCAEPVKTPDGKVIGVAIKTDASTLRVEIEADDVVVDIA